MDKPCGSKYSISAPAAQAQSRQIVQKKVVAVVSDCLYLSNNLDLTTLQLFRYVTKAK